MELYRGGGEGAWCCRICGRGQHPKCNFIHLYSDEGRRRQLLNKIFFCFSKQVLYIHANDGLPKVICQDCQDALTNSFNHAKKIFQLQNYLKEKFGVKAMDSARMANVWRNPEDDVKDIKPILMDNQNQAPEPSPLKRPNSLDFSSKRVKQESSTSLPPFQSISSTDSLTTPEMPTNMLIEDDQKLESPNAKAMFPSVGQNQLNQNVAYADLPRSHPVMVTSPPPYRPTKSSNASMFVQAPVVSAITTTTPALPMNLNNNNNTVLLHEKRQSFPTDKTAPGVINQSHFQHQLQLKLQRLQSHEQTQNSMPQMTQNVPFVVTESSVKSSNANEANAPTTRVSTAAATLVKVVPVASNSVFPNQFGDGRLAANVTLPDGRVIQVPVVDGDNFQNICLKQNLLSPIRNGPGGKDVTASVNMSTNLGHKEHPKGPIEMVHVGVDKVKCSLCGCVFNETGEPLRMHGITIHDNDKLIHKCSLCSLTAGSGQVMAKHFASHQNQIQPKPADNSTPTLSNANVSGHTCPICRKDGFESKASMKQHMQSAHFATNSAHECPTCLRNFASKATLKRHQLTHTGERPFACTECKSAFTQKSVLNAHMKTHMRKKLQEAAKESNNAPPSQQKNVNSKEPSTMNVGNPSQPVQNGSKDSNKQAPEPPYLCPTCGQRFLDQTLALTHSEQCRKVQQGQPSNASETTKSSVQEHK